MDITWRGSFTSSEVNRLHAEAFGTRVFGDDEWDWSVLCERHSLGWVTARSAEGRLVAFANVLTDGLVHAWLQDVMVDASARHQGVGRAVVRAAADGARAAGCEILHVDYDPELERFYVDACGFSPTSAALLHLQP